MAYGNVVTAGLPSVITTALTLSSSDNSLASGGGVVTDEGGAEVTARGICWLPNNATPTTANPKTTDGDRSGAFSSAVTGLLNGTTYYFRAYATNAYGTAYGPYIPLTTKVVPTLSTNTPSISTDRPGVASAGGNITNDGGANITSRGVCWSSTNSSPTIADAHSSDGTGAGNFSSILTGLDASKKYYVRAYATNSAGLAYGNVVTAGLPSVITTALTLSSSDNSLASGGGVVTDEGGAEVTARGICWLPNNATPTTANPKTTDGDRSGAFSSAVTGLLNGTTYYFRAYATNAYGTAYGPYIPLTTKVVPTLSTNTPSISADQPGIVFAGGKITNDGGAGITEKGVCWSSTNSSPTIADSHSSDGSGSGDFTSTLTGLVATKMYYIRAYAKNSAGISYGNITTPALPSVTTGDVTLSGTDISMATGGGNVTNEGGLEVSARGICWSSSTSAPTITNSSFTKDYSRGGIFTSSLTGLKKGNTYYVRAYATNPLGTIYGNVVMFVIP
ncbi:MAG: hypothetical protein F8N35_04370 [Paludibacter sp.]|nr:hypothetical protein [Paludibacter sp.]